MKRISATTIILFTIMFPSSAMADHDYRDDCQGGGCGNEREESYEGAGCKYVCPKFDKSPVQDSFNIQICVQPGSCSPEEKKPGQQPTGIACLVPYPYHCNPKPS